MIEARVPWEAVDDGYVEHAHGHDVGHGAVLAAGDRVSGAWDRRSDKVPAFLIAKHTLFWLPGLRVYLAVVFVGSLAWEVLHLPLYSIWTTGTLREQAFAAGHCTLGDLVIAACALMLALLLAGVPRWPRDGFWPIAILTVAFGLAYTVFSEWLNVVVRAAWTYTNPLSG
jgi:hypothetical protein